MLFFIPNLTLAHSDSVNLDKLNINFKGELVKQKTTEIALEAISGEEVEKTTDIESPQLDFTNIKLENQYSFVTQTNDNPNNAQYIQMDTKV